MENEAILNQNFRETPIILIYKFIVLVVVFNVILLLVSILSDYIDFFNKSTFIFSIGLDSLSFLFLIIVQILLIIYISAHWYFKQYIFDGRQIIIKFGIFNKQEKKIYYSKH